MPLPGKVSLAALSRELTAYTGQKSPGYRALWNMTVDGDLPTVQVNGRYEVARTDIPAIAVMLGMMPAETQPAKTRKVRQVLPSPKRRKGIAPTSIAA